MRIDLLGQVRRLGLDLVKLPVQRRLVAPPAPKQGQPPVPLGSLLLQQSPEALQFLLAALLLVTVQFQPLPQPFQKLAGVAQESLDVSPYHALDIVAVDVLGRTLLPGVAVQPPCELPSVAAVVEIPLRRLHRHSREGKAAEST